MSEERMNNRHLVWEDKADTENVDSVVVFGVWVFELFGCTYQVSFFLVYVNMFANLLLYIDHYQTDQQREFTGRRL